MKSFEVCWNIPLIMGSSRVVLMNGIGGIGKTLLTKVFFHTYKEAYTHLIWVEQKETLLKSFTADENLINNLGVDISDHPGDELLVKRIFNEIRNLKGKNLLYEQVLEYKLEHYGQDHLKVAKQKRNLAVVHRSLKKYEVAKTLLEEALEMDLALSPDDKKNIANKQYNLSLVLRDLGEVGRAEELWEEAAATYREILDEDHPTALEVQRWEDCIMD